MEQMTTSELIGKLASRTADRDAVLAILRTRDVYAEVVPLSALTDDERLDRIFDLND